jgi:hypothetical protein
VVEAVVGGVEVAVETLETVGTIETAVVCVLVSWMFAGSGVVCVVETLGTVGTVKIIIVYISISWTLRDQGFSR